MRVFTAEIFMTEEEIREEEKSSMRSSTSLASFFRRS